MRLTAAHSGVLSTLALLLLSTFWTPLARAAGNAPSVRHMYFKDPLSKLLYFKNPAVILGLDKTSGKVYRSEKYGAQWKVVSDIPEGKAMRMYAHPFEAKIAYVLSKGTEHWLTRDEGRSWEGFSTPLVPTQSGERPLSFHAERTRWVMFIGERCVEETSGWWPFPRQVCHDEALYTRDGFEQAARDYKSGDRSGAAITPLMGDNKPVSKCLWARHTKEFASMAEEAIFCLEIVPVGKADSESLVRRSLQTNTTSLVGRRVHMREAIYPHLQQSVDDGDGVMLGKHSAALDFDFAEQHGKLTRRSLEGDIAGMLDGLTRRNTVRLVVSEDFFKTQRVVHFGTGTDGTGGDRAGGGVLAVSVVKDYVLVAISHAHSDEMDLFVSMDGHVWAESRLPLPPGTKEDAYTILESTKYAVLVDVVADDALTGTLFRSNSNGTYYTLALEHTHRSANGLVDVERVHGVEGVMIANQVSNWEKLGGVFSRRHAELRSRISFNDGARWRFLQPPERDASGKRYGCSHDGGATGECALHVHSVTSTRTPGRVFGVAAVPGVVAAVGSVGSSLNAWRESDTFLSRDSGLTWTAVHAGAYHVQLADAGATIVLASDGEATAEVRYSLNGGTSWETVALEQRLRISALFVDDEGLSPAVVAVGVVSDGTHAGEQAIVALDFSSSWKRQCSVDANNPKPGRDTERFVLTAHEDDDCVMGHRTDYVRRRADAQCAMRLDRVLVPQQEDCACARRDFECDYGYAPTEDGKCKLAGAEVVPKGQCQHPGDRFMASSGYRLIPGNTCARGRGSELDEPVERLCPRVQAPGDSSGNNGEHHTDGSISHYSTSVRGEPHIMAFPNTTSFIMMTSARELFRTDDEGARWLPVDLGIKTGKPVFLAEHRYDAQRAFVYTEDDVMLATRDRGASWTRLQVPGSANRLHIRPLLDFHPTNADWLLFVGGTECPGCHSEIWVSRDNGEHWNCITTHATKCAFARSNEFTKLPDAAVVCLNYRRTGGGNDEQDHQAARGGANVIEVRVFDRPFDSVDFRLLPVPDAEHSEIAEFHMYSRFMVFACVHHALDDTGRASAELRLLVSDDGHTMHAARFPPGTNLRPEGFTLLPAHAGTILIDVEGAPNTGDPEWGTGWGTLFASNANGTHFHRVLDHTNRNRMGVVDVERVDGLHGMMVANRVVNTEALGLPGVRKRLRTVASWDDGRSWHPLTPPDATTDDCPDCSLNLYSHSALIGASELFSVSSAPGALIAVGSVGPHLGRLGTSHTYFSRDGGRSWVEASESVSRYAFADHGSILLLVDPASPTDEVRYSSDGGRLWQTYRFETDGSLMFVERMIGGAGQQVLLIGRQVLSSGGMDLAHTQIVSVDFSKLHDRQCVRDTRDHSQSDFELWTPRWGIDVSGRDAPICVLGAETAYWRRKPTAACFVGDEFVPGQTRTTPCKCSLQDFECDEGFWLNDYGQCLLDGPDPYQPADCREGSTYKGRSGYRRNSMSQCVGGKDLAEPIDRICGRTGGISTAVRVLDSPVADLQFFKNSPHVMVRTTANRVFVSLNEGARWEPLPALDLKGSKSSVTDQFATIVRQPYFDDYAYFVPRTGTVALYTDDEARTTRILHLPGPPAHLYQPVLRFHPDYPEWLIYLAQPNEHCTHVDAHSCRVEAFLSRDHGAHWNTLAAQLGPAGCVFLRTNRLRKSHSNTVVCVRHPGASEGGADVVVSENWFRSETVLVRNATDFAAIGEFLLVSQDAAGGKALTMHISLDGKTSAVAQFPGDRQTLDPAYTVLEPPEGFEYRDLDGFMQKMPGAGLMLHVTKNNHAGAEWGSIYSSNSNGTFYRRSLEHVNRDENGLVDFERIRALEGVAIANIVANPDAVSKYNRPKLLQSMITVDGGSRWHFMRLESGTAVPCRQSAPQKGECSLHLHGYTEVSDPENIYSATGAVGLVMGVGSVGSHLKRIGESDTYLSSDGGATWRLARKGAMWHEFGDHGALIVIADRIHPIAEIEYSLDQARTWQSLQLPEEARSMRVEILTTTPDSTSRRFVLYGKRDNSERGIIVGLDFTGAQPRVCNFDPEDEKNHKNKDDFELFTPKTIDASSGEDSCLLGRKVQYYRRISDHKCYVGDEFRPTRFISNICECTERDYECNQNFIREPSADDDKLGKCVLVKGMQAPRTNCTEGEKDYFVIEAPYRKIPQSICRSGLILDKPTEVWCPGKARTVAIFWSLLLPVVFLTLAYVAYKAWRDRYPYLRLEDIGTAVRPTIRNLAPHRPQSGILKQLEPVFVGALATAQAVSSAAKEGFLWGLDRAAPYLPRAVQHWSYEHPPRWGAQLSMDGRSRRNIRRSDGESRFSYRPLATNEAASRVFGSYDDVQGTEFVDAPDVDVYDEVEAGFNHFLEEENARYNDVGEADARLVDRQVLFANAELSDEEDDNINNPTSPTNINPSQS
ncbi:vacuolar protein sorting/targeting protein PEP1 [Coemansia sp. RSA 1365]|nr:vacuolar protein sorting/targeting protein PEP1 [Coemansia sp. RSA 1365]